MPTPFASVLIDTYNHERFIERAVVSVLEQDFAAGEREWSGAGMEHRGGTALAGGNALGCWYGERSGRCEDGMTKP
jgi:hypothetical protein